MVSDRFTKNRRGRDARHLSPLLRMALLFGVLAHLIGFLVFRVASNPLPSGEEDIPFVALVSADPDGSAEQLIEQASLFDSAPLFIPGEWSSASKVFASKSVRDWPDFPDFEPNIELVDEVRPDSLSLSRAADVEQPSDFLNLRFFELFRHFGEVERGVDAPENRKSVAVVTLMSGSEIYPAGYEIRLGIDLATENFGMRPVVCVFNISTTGLPMGTPVLEQSSGSSSLDAEVLDLLNRPAMLAQLPAGFLKLRVFP